MPGPDDDSTDDPAWEGERVARWLRQAEDLDRQLTPVSDHLFAAADLRRGERVLDVGCGAGPTTRRAATLVGRNGRVTGIDISEEMVRSAASTEAPVDGAPIDWVTADVTVWSPPTGAFDIVISRFGVMFFSDPRAAFGNLARATTEGGRLATAIWSHRDRSPLFEVPLGAAVAIVRSQGQTLPALPVDGGPFSLGSDESVADALVDTGWHDVRVAFRDLEMAFAGGVGPRTAAEASADFGPTRVVLDSCDAPTRRLALAAIADAFAEHLDHQGHVVLPGRVGIITAVR